MNQRGGKIKREQAPRPERLSDEEAEEIISDSR